MTASGRGDVKWLLSEWLFRRLLEFAVFFSIFVIYALIISEKNYGGIGYIISIAFAAVSFFYVPALFAPASLVLFFVFRNSCRARGMADPAFFILYSWVVLSVAHNGPIGVDQKIDYQTPIFFAWGACVIVSLVVALLGLRKRAGGDR